MKFIQSCEKANENTAIEWLSSDTEVHQVCTDEKNNFSVSE